MMRGPGTRPALMASRSAKIDSLGDPRSATVVKPALSVFIAYQAPSSARSERVLVKRSIRWLGPFSPVRWTWLSIRPGSTKLSFRSTTLAQPSET